ncbi:phospholipid-transporting ATPase ABCA3-like [Dermacentor silvarum]|uniref:phospholipid-transporting ATPase ABCA3-like n=1 Tax=Dermacentor silvarum TaxID=543639 RepID=UPI0021010455|nr:phospholipid-transporting ATPase ABCA3-like [Dermacentor silvarum]
MGAEVWVLSPGLQWPVPRTEPGRGNSIESPRTADKHGGYLPFQRRNEQSGDSDGDQSSEDGDKHETVPDAADLKYVEVESRDAVAGACAKLYDLKMFPNENSTAILRAPLCLALSEPESAASASLEYTVYVPTEDIGKMEKMLPLGGAFAPNDNLTLMIGLMFYINIAGQPYAKGIDVSLLAVSFLIFDVGYALLIILIMWVFPKGWIGLIIGLVSVFYGVRISDSASSISVPRYITTSKADKLLTALLPAEGFFAVLRIAFLARDYEGGTGWSVVTRNVLDVDNITILEIWLAMFACDIVMVFLACYLHNVLPWSTDNPQRPLFFLAPNYWNPKGTVSIEGATPSQQNPARFEEIPADIRPIIIANNITKMYGKKPALSAVDFRVYESKVTVLLGHNGAGKTTLMSILTGKQAPSSGIAKVCGFNVATHSGEVRKLVSFCQQNDIFFDDLTVIDNLIYFASLKGAASKDVYEAVGSALRLVGLEDKTPSYPSELSGGMKRRLSIAITFATDPKLLILDEPTAGTDPQTRRGIWDALQIKAKTKSLLISSHDMDEADAIGDHIIIMASGKVICSGSTAFLKKACGVGYKLTIAKTPGALQLPKVLAVIQRAAPEATVDDEKQAEVVITLRTLDYKDFPAMFQTLESSSRTLGIASMGVTVSTMRDAYLKINLEWSPEGKAREVPVDEQDIDNVCRAVEKKRTITRSFYALFVKRLVILARNWWLLLGMSVLPLLLLLATRDLSIQRPGSAGGDLGSTFPAAIDLGTHFAGSEVIFQETLPNELSTQVRLLVESEGCTLRPAKDAREELRRLARDDIRRYITTYPVAFAFEPDRMGLLANPTSMITTPIAINLMSTAILRALTGKPAERIDATLTHIKVRSKTALHELNAFRSDVSSSWRILPALVYSLGFAVLAAFPVDERLGGARDVQLMTGMSGAFFIFVHLVFDMFYYVVYMSLFGAVHFSLSNYSVTTAGNFALMFLSAAPAIIGMAYVIAERAETSGGAMSSAVQWVYIGGTAASGLNPEQ